MLSVGSGIRIYKESARIDLAERGIYVARKLWRGFFYFLGLVILAFGITLNTKTGLGVSPLMSVPFVASQIWGFSLGNMTLVSYVVFILLQIILKEKGPHWRVLLQVPMSIVFTRLIDLFSSNIPIQTRFGGQLVMLALAIVLTGIGAAISLDMRLIPNPADGAVQTISDFSQKEMGLCKNCFDAACTLIAVCLSLICGGEVIGVGIGTAAAILGVGRVIALFNRLFLKHLQALSGL